MPRFRQINASTRCSAVPGDRRRDRPKARRSRSSCRCSGKPERPPETKRSQSSHSSAHPSSRPENERFPAPRTSDTASYSSRMTLRPRIGQVARRSSLGQARGIPRTQSRNILLSDLRDNLFPKCFAYRVFLLIIELSFAIASVRVRLYAGSAQASCGDSVVAMGGSYFSASTSPPSNDSSAKEDEALAIRMDRNFFG